MNIILEGMSTLSPAQYNFVKAGFTVGTAAGSWPTWRHGPTEEEQVALAMEGDTILGFATFFHTEPYDRVWLDLLWVAPEHRRKSAGTRLLAAVLAYGERHGLAVEFGTLSSNEPMQKMAASFGLQTYTMGYRKEPLAA